MYVAYRNRSPISIYYTCTLLLTKKYDNAHLDVSDNVISGNEHSSEMHTSQSHKPELAKIGNAKDSPKWVIRNIPNLDI